MNTLFDQPPTLESLLARIEADVSYDPNTGIFRWKINRGRGAKIGNIAGTVKKKGYRVIVINRKSFYAHRLAFLFMLRRFPTDQVDHVNRVKDDNRWSNLRECTNAENHQNMPMRAENTSGVQCVSVDSKTGKWRAQVTSFKKSLKAPRRATVSEAAADVPLLRARMGLSHEPV